MILGCNMRRIILALVILLCLFGKASADLGDPTIQAVCRIKLASGHSYEGFITEEMVRPYRREEAGCLGNRF